MDNNVNPKSKIFFHASCPVRVAKKKRRLSAVKQTPPLGWDWDENIKKIPLSR